MTPRFRKGDIVLVKTDSEISKTLDGNSSFNGCRFLQGMRRYCGSEQRVLKRVEKYLDERDYLLKKCEGVVLLENLFCEGEPGFERCGRACSFLWREECLVKPKHNDDSPGEAQL